MNVGSGNEVSILELAKMIARVLKDSGELITDPSKPDGTPSKLLDSAPSKALVGIPALICSTA